MVQDRGDHGFLDLEQSLGGAAILVIRLEVAGAGTPGVGGRGYCSDIHYTAYKEHFTSGGHQNYVGI